MRFFTLSIVFLACVAGHELANLAVAGPNLPGELRQGLEETSQAVQTLSITWERRRTSPLTREQLATELAEKEYALFTDPSTEKLILQDGKYYSLSRFPSTNGVGTVQLNSTESSYDRAYWYSGTGVENAVRLGGSPVLLVERIGDLRAKGNMRLRECDYFAAAGFWVPELLADIDQPATSLILRALAEKAEILNVEDVQHDDRPCSLLELRSQKTTSREMPPLGILPHPPKLRKFS